MTHSFWFILHYLSPYSRYKLSALAIELTSSKAIAGKKLSLSSFGVLHHYIFIIAQLWLTSHPRNTVVLLHRNSWYQQRNFQ